MPNFKTLLVVSSLFHFLTVSCLFDGLLEEERELPPQEEVEMKKIPEEDTLLYPLTISLWPLDTTFYLDKENAPFAITLNNTGNDTLFVWQEWNSWGYYNVSFELATNDSTYLLKRKPRGWDKNFPSYWAIASKEEHQFALGLSDETWEGFPNGVDEKASLKCIYTIEEDEQTKEYKVWTGSIESQELDIWIKM